jgi:hypothetical protein
MSESPDEYLRSQARRRGQPEPEPQPERPVKRAPLVSQGGRSPGYLRPPSQSPCSPPAVDDSVGVGRVGHVRT